MNRRFLSRLASLGIVVALFSPSSAHAYQYIWDCRGEVVWDSSNVTFQPSLVSFPNGSAWQNSINAMRTIWNTESPGSNYRIQHTWAANNTWATNDGRNSIVIATPAEWTFGAGTLAVTFSRRSTCNIWPFSRADLVEADIAFNPAPFLGWDTAVNPAPPHPQGPFNSTLVGIHEHGHAFGLDHENDIMATLNAFYPNSGVIGNGNETQPHSDDTYAVRVGYGTAVTARDLAASAFRRTGAGTSGVIPAPAASDRNARVSFPFTISNRGTTNQSSVQVRFYLSADRNITTADTFLGSATFNLNAGVTTTPTANVTIPSTAPTGNRFLGWIVDPLNAVAESDEANNGVGLTTTTNIRTNRAPTACFTPTNSFGPAPLPVSFSASCSSDADGNPLTYTWNFGDGTTGTGVSPFHLYYDPGYYSVTLTVRDSTGATATAFGYVNVSCTSGGFGELCPFEEP